jgi:hypothetical protein
MSFKKVPLQLLVAVWFESMQRSRPLGDRVGFVLHLGSALNTLTHPGCFKIKAPWKRIISFLWTSC